MINMKKESNIISSIYEKVLNYSPETGIRLDSAQRLELQRLLKRHEKLGLQGAFLNFKEKDESFKKNYCVFQDKAKYKNKQLNLKSQNNNLLIEGENYHALKALQQANVKVDIIYIDPPYNTGKEFIFNDKIIDPSDDYRHSKWLSFMKLRLEVAKELLNYNGVIFVSIDDNEQAYLKVLMDEIFGQNNFICNFIWEKTYSPKNNNKFVSNDHDYILAYRQSDQLEFFDRLERTAKNNKVYTYNDQDGKGFYCLADLTIKNGKRFSITIEGKKYDPGENHQGWRYSKEKINALINEKRVYIPKNGDRLRYKRYLNEVQDVISRSILGHKLVGHNDQNQKELNKILGAQKFEYPKGIKLLKYLLKLVPNNQNATILDFFAGSGTTGHAVLALNEEDNGTRRFILINEKEDKATKEQKCITQITYERLYRIIKGKGTNGESIEWELSSKKKAFLHASLRFLEIKHINKLNGQFEDFETPQIKSLYKTEFNHNIKIQDFRDND